MAALFSVPNLLSLGNLLCGCIAVLNVIDGNIGTAVYLVMLACVFDFLDGFAARGLKQGSPMGKELDSLADMVTFGVVPGMVMFQLIRFAGGENVEGWRIYLPYIGFVIPLFSALRLAKFNVDTRQSESFIGLPTLANALLICGLPVMFGLHDKDNYAFSGFNYYMQATAPDITGTFNELTSAIASFWRSQMTLICITFLLSFLLISPIPMFSFKIKSVKWKGNEIRYIFAGIAVSLIGLMQLAALPLIIVIYILLSLVYGMIQRSS